MVGGRVGKADVCLDDDFRCPLFQHQSFDFDCTRYDLGQDGMRVFDVAGVSSCSVAWCGLPKNSKERFPVYKPTKMVEEANKLIYGIARIALC